MKLWAVGQDSGVMLTALKPQRSRVGKTDKYDYYMKAGDPIGVRHLCYIGFYHLTGLHREDIEHPTRIELTGSKICP